MNSGVGGRERWVRGVKLENSAGGGREKRVTERESE